VPRRADRRNERDARRLRAFGERVRVLRVERGLTQEDLAEAADLYRAEIGLIENARREASYTIICRLADGFGLTASQLLDGVPS